jgi:hypothetical protein
MGTPLEEAATRWAAGRADVRALLIVGSRARIDTPADAFSDHDFVVVVEDAQPFVDSAAWVAEIGPPAVRAACALFQDVCAELEPVELDLDGVRRILAEL